MSVRLFINHPKTGASQEIILDQKRTVNISLGVKGFTNVVGESSTLNFFSLTIDIPMEVNRETLRSMADANSARSGSYIGFKSGARIEDNFLTFLGNITFNGYKIRKGVQTIQAQFLAGIANVFDQLPDKIRELPFRTYEHTAANIDLIEQQVTPYDYQTEVYFTQKHYQTNTTPGTLETLDRRPDIYSGAIIDAIESHLGIQIQSQFFGTEWFRQIMHPYTGEELFRYLLVEADLNANIISAGAIDLDLFAGPWNITTDPLGLIAVGLPMVILPIPISSGQTNFVTVEMEVDVTVAGGSARSVFLSDANSNLFDQTIVNDGPNTIVMRGGPYVRQSALDFPRVFFEGPITINAGSTIKIYMEGELFTEDVPIDVASCFKEDDKVDDYLKGITELFNLIWYYDEFTGQMIVEPKWDYTLPNGESGKGFYRNLALAPDWSAYVDCDNESGNYKPVASLRQLFTLAFKGDNDDTLIPRNNRLYAREIELNDKYKAGEKLQRNTMFAPTIVREFNPDYIAVTGDALPVPTFIKDEEWLDEIPVGEDEHFGFEMRLLYKLGYFRINGYQYNGTAKGFQAIAAHQYTYDLSGSFQGVHTANLGYDDYKGVPGLVSIFYEQDIVLYNYAWRVRLSTNLPLSELFNIERLFRYLKFAGTKNGGARNYILETISLKLGQRTKTDLSLMVLAPGGNPTDDWK